MYVQTCFFFRCLTMLIVTSMNVGKFLNRNCVVYLLFSAFYAPKSSEYDQKITRSQTADKPMAAQGRATQS